MGPATVDFWWLKPDKENSSALEEKTLNRHAKGAHKNDPGASRKALAPFATFFARSGTSADGKLRYGVGTAPAGLGGMPPANGAVSSKLFSLDLDYVLDIPIHCCISSYYKT